MGILKNDVGRPSKKIIRTRFIFKLVLTVVISFVIGYLLGKYVIPEKEDVKNNIVEETDYKKDLLVEKAKGLIGQFYAINNDHYTFGYFYKEDRNLNNLDDDIIIITAILNSDQVEYSRGGITQYDVRNEIDKIFGNIKYENKKLGNLCCTINNDNETEVYTYDCGCSGDGPHIENAIVDVQEKDNKLEIIEKIGITNFNQDTGSSTLYKDINMTQIIKENYSINEGIKDYLDDLDSYKWVFAKNEVGNYIFESVEKEQEF